MKGYGSYDSKQGYLPFKGGWSPHEGYDNSVWDSMKEGNTYKGLGYDKMSKMMQDYEEDEKGIWRKKKDKKLSDMTDKEFQQWEELETAKQVFEKDQNSQFKIDEPTALAFLNSIFDNSYMLENYKDVRETLVELNKKNSGVIEMEEYLDDWQEKLQEHFDVIWHGGTIDQYSQVLVELDNVLHKYKYIRIAQGMLDAIENEKEVLTIIQD